MRTQGGQRDSGGTGDALDQDSGAAQDALRVTVGDREIFLVGTAHVSRESVEEVRAAIQAHRPERVCVELDEGRFEALSNNQRFDDLDLREVFRRRQLATLLLNLLLAHYQRQLGDQLGVPPGTELLEATRAAEAAGIPVSLVDRDIRITLRRAWGAMRWFQKFHLAASLLTALVSRPEIDEEQLRELRQQDALGGLMEELGEAFPVLKRVLIDERDHYLAEQIRRTSERTVVAVVGAGHIEGIRRILTSGEPVALEPLEAIPPTARWGHALGWSIPALIVTALVWIGVRQGADAAQHNVGYWILANGIPAAAGAFLARAHPATLAAAFTAAPLTSLTPVIGVGYVTAFVQSYFRPPLVRELRGTLDAMGHFREWWRNRLLQIFLVFGLTTVGSLLGTALGAAEIFRNLAP